MQVFNHARLLFVCNCIQTNPGLWERPNLEYILIQDATRLSLKITDVIYFFVGLTTYCLSAKYWTTITGNTVGLFYDHAFSRRYLLTRACCRHS